MTVNERLRDKANSLPQSPGVYIMRDKNGTVIYVGKSKKLKNRVGSYFISGEKTVKTAKMVSLVRDFDYIVCSTEIEALTLENVLIKKHSPKYNIRLKDSKSYPYIKITAEPYPRILVTRERRSDHAKYFGPYSGVSQAYGAMNAVMRVFSLPSCKRSFPRDVGKERPCIYKDMGRCIAPCAGGVGAEEYSELIRRAARVLSGDTAEIVGEMRVQMLRASEDMEFERAARMRDGIAALEKLSEKQKVVGEEKLSRDVFAIATSGTVGVLSMLSVRRGSLINKNDLDLSYSTEAAEDEIISLIADYYDGAPDIPKEIILDFNISDDDTELLSEYVTALAEHKVTVRIPERGDGRALCKMARSNAEEALRQKILEGERENKNVRRLAELLSLDGVPERIEAYDISNIGNENIVASMVVWAGGKLKKSDYRLFNIKSTAGQDDYGSMREALGRRLSHIGDGTLSLGETPELILVDGGAGHVSTALEVMRELGIDVPVFGMVKDDYHKTRALTDGESEISIAKEFDVYAFIYNLQEEAHRFAVKASGGAKRKTLTHSSLERIDGIGPAKAKKLLAKMTLTEIKAATAEELVKKGGLGKGDAERIFKYFSQTR